MTPTHVDRKTFLANLRQSKLIGVQEFRALKPRLPRTRRGRILARALVEWGVLTRFQAELLLAGRTQGFLLGQYRILDQLGQGGMGRVFKAVHRTMNRVVAVKVLAPHLVRTEKAQHLFQREVRAAARLIHPNIVTAYDANQIGDRHFLVMEYVDGPNLEQLVRRHGPLPVDLACDLMRQVAGGLQYAAEMGMVHRDIKPANILLQTGGEQRDNLVVAKILDFGLARLQEPEGDARPGTIVTRDHVVMGTPDFLSPEQARNLHQVDIRSDLYSLGCTFYYLLAGKVPFPGGTTLEKLVRHNTEAPIPLDKVRAEVPAAVVAVINRLLAKKPEDRFQTPAQLAAVLAPLVPDGPRDWAIPLPPGSSGSLDALTPDNSFTGLEGLVPSGSNSGSALAGTVGMNTSPTPMSGADMAAVGQRRGRIRSGNQPLKLALAVAVGVAIGLASVLTWLLVR
jgi:serine/threonine protein kinase